MAMCLSSMRVLRNSNRGIDVVGLIAVYVQKLFRKLRTSPVTLALKFLGQQCLNQGSRMPWGGDNVCLN